MKLVLLGTAVIFSMVVMNPPTVSCSEDDLIRASLKKFFAVLQSGDVTAIESVIGGELLEETSVLLRNNKEYGGYLRSYYTNSEFQVEKIVHVTDGAVVDVSVIFENGDREQFTFLLAKTQIPEKGDDGWKVVKQKRLASDI